MTDAVQGGTEWVPRFGMLEVPADRAALIRGLFELAAFVADHPELPLPKVQADIWPRGEDYVAEVDEVNDVAAALGVTAGFVFGGVEVQSVAITRESLETLKAHMSYRDNVQPAEGVAAGESR